MKKTLSPSTRSIRAVGRRKTATAVFTMTSGKQDEQQVTVNGKPIGEYWPGPALQMVWQEPFRTTNTLNRFTGAARVAGSGKMAQLDAFVLAASRALQEVDQEKFRPILKKRGLLTRDPRSKERRKPGLAHKARAKKQSPKR